MIFLIRHGQYDVKDSRDSVTGRGLTPIGVRQAQLTAARLHHDPGPSEVSQLLSSDFVRARETAEIIGAAFSLAPVVRDVLREIDFEYQPGRDYSKSSARVANEPGLLSAARAFDEHLCSSSWKSRHALIVCHADLIRYFVCRIAQPTAAEFADMFVSNCSVTTLSVSTDGLVELVAFAEDEHLPDEIHTFA